MTQNAISPLVPFLLHRGAIRGPGHFPLASGKHTQRLIDMSCLPPYIMDTVRAMAIEKYAGWDIDIVVGVPRGGTPFADVIAPTLSMYRLHGELVRHVLLDKHPDDGSFSLRPGSVRPGERALVVDDVGTTYGSLLRACSVLAAAGVVVERKLVIVNRNPRKRDAVRNGVEFFEHYPIKAFRASHCILCAKGIPLEKA